ncbi:MAG: cupin domain-containing protein [Nitrospirae bacterium]|nr:MAG: cupin domain-containing protein [Nitrospirota bacterium]
MKREKQKAYAPSCDWTAPSKPEAVTENKDRIHRYKGDGKWSGVKTEKYKNQNGGWASIVRNVLIGNCGESAKFHLRYFEIAPGGFSSLERHKHEHVVVCIRGKGKIQVGRKQYTLNFLDTAYIAPDTAHQLLNHYDNPFGFFCIVNAKRDRPKPVKKA